jgi:hypothetical protein
MFIKYRDQSIHSFRRYLYDIGTDRIDDRRNRRMDRQRLQVIEALRISDNSGK